MSANPIVSPAPRPVERRRAVALAMLGSWTIVVPYLGKALGLGVNVSSSVEIVDHVVPGALVAAVGLYLSALARRRSFVGDRFALLGCSVCFLAGFWVLATHLPLLADAVRSREPWGAAIWHSIAGLPMVAIAIVALWAALPESPDP